MTTQLNISSPDNPDWHGSWIKSEVEQEMAELGIDGNWLEYILEHVFDSEWCGASYNLFLEDPQIRLLGIQLKSGYARIERVVD